MQLRYNFPKPHMFYIYKSSVFQPVILFQTWMKIADGFYKDPSCSDVYGHIVGTLSQLHDRNAVWKFADWTLQRNQEVPFSIFHAVNVTAEGRVAQ